jgi:hypothetical protein
MSDYFFCLAAAVVMHSLTVDLLTLLLHEPVLEIKEEGRLQVQGIASLTWLTL